MGKKIDNLPDTFDEVRAKLRDILLRSKTGRSTSDAENEFARECWERWPTEYSELRQQDVIPAATKTVNPFA